MSKDWEKQAEKAGWTPPEKEKEEIKCPPHEYRHSWNGHHGDETKESQMCIKCNKFRYQIRHRHTGIVIKDWYDEN